MNIVTKWDKPSNKRIFDKSFQKRLDTNNRMTDSNAESNWIVPEARQMARKGIF